MSHSDWISAVSPKVNGAWNLHHVLQEQRHPLDFLLFTSSLFTAIEHPGQGNYNAANTFLEAFCQYRHSLGLTASVLNICPIDRIGFFADNPCARQKMKNQGFYFLDENAFLEFANSSILNSEPRPASQERSIWKNPSHLFMGLHSPLPLSHPANRASWRRDRRMGFYHNVSWDKSIHHMSSTSASTTADETLTALLTCCRSDPSLLTQSATHQTLAVAIGRQVLRQRLRDEEAEIDVQVGLAQMGVDSLVAVELRRWVRVKMRVEVSVVEMVGGRTLGEVGALVAGRIAEGA